MTMIMAMTNLTRKMTSSNSSLHNSNPFKISTTNKMTPMTMTNSTLCPRATIRIKNDPQNLTRFCIEPKTSQITPMATIMNNYITPKRKTDKRKWPSNSSNKINNYPLLEKGFTNEDIYSGVEVLLSKKITMSSITKKFEKAFAKYVGAKYELMVNSGS